MIKRGENWRFWFPVIVLAAFVAYVGQKAVRCHLEEEAVAPKYTFEKDIDAQRGSIYARDGKSLLAKSVPVWEYRLDPVALTNRVVRPRGRAPKTRKEIAQTIAKALHLDYQKVLKMCRDTRNRYQYLTTSSDTDAHAIIADSREVAGVIILDTQIRDYPQGRRLSHVLGAVNKSNVGAAGLELKFNKELSGVAGRISGILDVRRNELYDKRKETIAPIAGADITLTIDNNLQYEVEDALRWGLAEYGAATGWALIMDAKTGEILALASNPDFNPRYYGRAKESAHLNRTTGFVYEPGSVMKVITAAAGIDLGLVRPDSLYTTNRDDPRYYRLPGDGSHVWDPRMTVSNAIVHSSNIVIGKLAYDIGPKRLWAYMRDFGFGSKTGVELPGEESGLLWNWKKWDKATWSRAGIGQGIGVTALQLASAFQTLANDGVRMRPYLVKEVRSSKGNLLVKNGPQAVTRVVSRKTAQEARRMMLAVASPSGTARRGAIRGYSVAGKTGTAQKVQGSRGYAPGLFRATFCGIVPSGVMKRNPSDVAPVPPRLVILVTLDFDEKRRYHQGGNSSAPIFRRIATQALRYLSVESDKPWELDEYSSDDEFDSIMEARAQDLLDRVDDATE